MSSINTPLPSMMQMLLKHMVALTGHRDHTLLDTAIIAALQELVGASQVRVLDVFQLHDGLYLRQRVWICTGKVVTIEEEDLDDDDRELVANYPALESCIAERNLLAEEILADGSHRLWLPVWLGDKITTCLEISNPQPYPEHTINVIEGIMSVYRNYQNLLDYSERDSLTGLLNRKTFDERFSKMVSANAELLEETTQVEHPERRQQPDNYEHWLAVVDIDHFKRVNDQFGHLYGDEVLILVANRLRSSFRAQDRVFRFGGEEFVILLRSTSLENAGKIFDRFRTNIEQSAFPQVGTITVSIGFAGISIETPVVILGHADQALYYAKTHGRNRVCHYDQLVSCGQLHSKMPHESVEFFFDQPPVA